MALKSFSPILDIYTDFEVDTSNNFHCVTKVIKVLKTERVDSKKLDFFFIVTKSTIYRKQLLQINQ